MKTIKLFTFLSLAFLLAGMAKEARADSCAALIDDLVTWTQTPCSNCKNIVSYQMTVINNDKFTSYSDGRLAYNGSYFYTNSAKTLFSDRLWIADCSPQSGIICLKNQPFDYHRPETFAFSIKKPSTLNLDFTPWNEHYAINLSCQNGYIYGFQPGRLMVVIYPKKNHQDLPPK